MKLTEARLFTHTTRTLRAVNGEEQMILPGMYGNKPGHVDMVVLRYTLDGLSEKWLFDSAQLHGFALKQDGTDSKNRFDQNVYSYYMRENPERWEWLADLIHQARPTSSPVFPTAFVGRDFC